MLESMNKVTQDENQDSLLMSRDSQWQLASSGKPIGSNADLRLS